MERGGETVTEKELTEEIERLLHSDRESEWIEPKPVIEIFQNRDYKPEILMERDRRNERL